MGSDTLIEGSNMYKVDDFQQLTTLNITDLRNKLFCTFTTLEGMDGLIENITSSYDVMYNKIFILHIKSNNEYVCTYNIEQGNTDGLPSNTIMVHRKKDTNTLRKSAEINETCLTITSQSSFARLEKLIQITRKLLPRLFGHFRRPGPNRINN